MRPTEINPDYHEANDGRAIDWREHEGLCKLVARRMCNYNHRLEPHYDDIVEDLKVKLWECSRPGKFDPSKGIRFSTYACAAMFREYARTICLLYLGAKPTWKKRIEGNAVSLSTRVGRDGELLQMIAAEESSSGIDPQDLEHAMELAREIMGEDVYNMNIRQYNGQAKTEVGSRRNRRSDGRKKVRAKLAQGDERAITMATIAGVHHDE